MSLEDQTLVRIIQDVFVPDQTQLDDDLRLMDLENWDSMAHMLFITRVESEYEIALTGDEIASMRTLGDVRQVIRRRGESKS